MNAKDTKKGDIHTVDPKLLEILVCPLTKNELEYDAKAQDANLRVPSFRERFRFQPPFVVTQPLDRRGRGTQAVERKVQLPPMRHRCQQVADGLW